MQNFKGVKNPLVCISCQKVVRNLSSFLSTTSRLNQGIALDDHQLPSSTSYPVEIKDPQSSPNSLYTKVRFSGTWVYVKKDPDEKFDNHDQPPATTGFTVHNDKNKSTFQPCYKRILLNDEWVYVKVEPDDVIFKR